MKNISKQFENHKAQCLGKRDKSSAGRIDERCLEVCQVLNNLPVYYTTSSCSGRCFLYHGPGIKATDQFQRYRVSHGLVLDARRYFDVTTLDSDPTGGGDPLFVPDHGKGMIEGRGIDQGLKYDEIAAIATPAATISSASSPLQGRDREDAADAASPPPSPVLWLRYEPFILHVACRSLSAARILMDAARPSFKNVGLTTWKIKEGRFLVAVWGDEGLDLPLTTHKGTDLTEQLGYEWLARQCNERHERNWSKIHRFVEALRALSVSALEKDDDETDSGGANVDASQALDSGHALDRATTIPRSFDVIGDVALLHSNSTDDADERERIGNSILQKNKAIQIVAIRHSNLAGTERVAGDHGLSIIAGPRRDPLITTHCEYGIKCVVDLNRTFFTPRMAAERRRLCDLVGAGERVLVPFSGVAMEALQLAGRSPASEVVAVELNPVAVECARRGHRMLERNRALDDSLGAAGRLQILEGDVAEVLPTLPCDYYDRIVCPRPKEGALDGDLGDGSGGAHFLDAILPLLKRDGGVCHWYDFCSSFELPSCDRSRNALEEACRRHSLEMQLLRVTQVGSVAMRQYRVCLDFEVRLPLQQN